MASSIPSLLHALDTTRTQSHHIKTIAIAGMGFFTDAYNVFAISTVSRLLGRLYYYNNSVDGKPGQLPDTVNNLVIGVALIGTIIGIPTFGLLGDKVGRKKVYGISILLIVICSIGSSLSYGSTPKSVIGTLCFFRFWLGVGIGGEYPLSATIMSEYANKKYRGAVLAVVFAMYGIGIIFACLVSMVVSRIYLEFYHAPSFNQKRSEADYLWRIILMLGALPALLTLYWRMKMPETARFTAVIDGNVAQAVADMNRVLDINIDLEQDKVMKFNNYPLLSYEFFHFHGVHLVGTASCWFLLDLCFSTMNWSQKDVLPAIGFTKPRPEMNSVEEFFETSRAMFLVALGTFPGHLLAVFLIERVGRFFIQLIGFLMMSLTTLILWTKYDYLKDKKYAFVLIYGLTLFFANAGPLCTTFVLPAELFPTQVRSTCHALSAAAGKTGAMIGAFVVQKYTQNGDVNRIKHAFMFLAFTNMLGFCLTILMPETKGRSLEEISGEDSYSESTDAEVAT